jgi:hypothetical protein
MWVRSMSRREFVGILSTKRAMESIDAVEAPDDRLRAVDTRNEMIALWPMHPSECGPLPSVIIVPTDGQDEFLAWTATYVRDFRPFTAFCRVVSRAIAEEYLAAPATPSLQHVEGMCAGLILGEAMAQSQGRVDIREIAISTYPATLAYSLCRALALTRTPRFVDAVTSTWQHVREFTGQARTNVSSAAISFVWSVAFNAAISHQGQRTLFEASDSVREAWREYSQRGEFSVGTWDQLTGSVPEFSQLRDMSRLPREHRLILVDTALGKLASVGRDGSIRWSFIAGYITSMLGPGTLDHAEILLPVSTALPTALLWYGLFAGANPRGDGLPAGSTVARRIVRDLTSPDRLVDRPRCDMAFEELLMIAHPYGNRQLENLPGGRLDIDLIPGVTMAAYLPQHSSAKGEDASRLRDAELLHLLEEIDELSVRQRILSERLRGSLDLSSRSRPASNKRRKSEKP